MASRTMVRETELDFLFPDKFLRAESMELPGGIPGPTIVDALDGEISWTDTRNAPTGANVFVMRRAPGDDQSPAAVEKARTRSLRTQYLRNLLLYTLTPPPGSDVTFDLVGEADSPDGKLWIVDAAGPREVRSTDLHRPTEQPAGDGILARPAGRWRRHPHHAVQRSTAQGSQGRAAQDGRHARSLSKWSSSFVSPTTRSLAACWFPS